MVLVMLLRFKFGLLLGLVATYKLAPGLQFEG